MGKRRRSNKDQAVEGLQRVELPPVSHYLSTGCTILDLAIANQLPGGFGGGRISHVYGPESTAKTVLAQEPLGAAQRLGGQAWFADAEFTLDFERARLFGLDVKADSFHYSNPACIEDLFEEVVVGALKGRKSDDPPGIIAVDSLSALPSKAEIEESLSDTGYGVTRAKQLSRAFRKYVWSLNQANLALVFVDQVREDITSRVSRFTVSGGRALLFYASTRVFLSVKKKVVNDHDKVVGVNIGFKVEKNKLGPPFREGVFRLIFDIGVDDVATNLQWLKDNSDSSSEGPWYDCCGKNMKGLVAAVAYVEDNDLEEQLQEAVYERWKQVYATMERKPRCRV